MGHDARGKLPVRDPAKQYVLPDDFFMGAFGGLFLDQFS